MTSAWLAAALMALVLCNRLWRTDSVPLLIGLQGVAPVALLPSYLLAVVALWRRTWLLAVVALGLCAAQLVLTFGAVGWNGPQHLPPADLHIRIVTANVLYSNPQITELGDEIAAEDADVVVLQEVTAAVLRELRDSALWTDYAYHSTAPLPLYHGAATFSRFPIIDEGSIDVAGSPMLLTDLETPAGTLRVLNVHTVAPLTSVDAATWAEQFAALGSLAADSSFPIVMAGDFNATLDHAPLESLASGELRDAFRVAGSGFGTTWPLASLPIPPVMRLDHVLISAGIDVASVADRASLGSDHRRLVVDVGIAPQ